MGIPLGFVFIAVSHLTAFWYGTLNSKYPKALWPTSGPTTRGTSTISPANKRLIDVIVVGNCLRTSASATLAELGYNVKTFVSKILPRASIAARRNQRENYQGMGFYLPLVLRYIKGRGLPFPEAIKTFGWGFNQHHRPTWGWGSLRDYGGLLDNRHLRVLASRTFYAKGQTGNNCC